MVYKYFLINNLLHKKKSTRKQEGILLFLLIHLFAFVAYSSQVNNIVYIFPSNAPEKILPSYNSIVCLDMLKTNIHRVGFAVANGPISKDKGPGTKSSINQRHANTSSAVEGTPPRLINGVAVPAGFPVFEPSIMKETAPGYLFLQNWEGTPYIMILKNDGTPYFYRQVEMRSRDFKVTLDGNLARLVRLPALHYEIMNHNYMPIREIYAQNGYVIDEHEMQMTKEGTVLIIANDERNVDMSALVNGGNRNASVIGNHIQEIDKNDNVVFQWNCWDHFNIIDAVHEDLTKSRIDHIHMNSLAIDHDGHILASSRHLSECTKINRKTGEIIWRLGGVHNQFEFINDTGFSYQHDFRPVPENPGHYTLFDNGNYLHWDFSRAVEFFIDTDNMIAEKVWEYRFPEGSTHWMGNAQRLPNGNTLINGADQSLPKAIEVTPDSEVVYKGNWEDRINTYRTFRFEWQGMLLQPELIIEAYPNQITLIFNKFGDTLVKGFNIYGDGKHRPTELLATTENNYYVFTNELENQKKYYFRVKAYYNNGTESEESNIENIFVNLKKPGENLISNGGFSEGYNYWNLLVDETAMANGFVTGDKQYAFDISQGGGEYYHVQLEQKNIPLIKGTEYIFEFDAMATSPRLVEIKITKATDPWHNYSQTGLTYVEDEMQRFTNEFKMLYSSDFSARLVVNCGTDDNDVIVDNFSLREAGEFPASENAGPFDGPPFVFTHFQNTNLILQFNQVEPSYTIYALYDIHGKKWVEKSEYIIHNNFKSTINFTGYPKGMYLLQIISEPGNSSKSKIQTLKILYP